MHSQSSRTTRGRDDTAAPVPPRGTSVGDQLTSVGEFIGAQRKAAELSLRQLAEQAGVSNPYLSQIERGLRKPSAEVLQQVAKALRVSAETLYVRAGILDPAEHNSHAVEQVILAETSITERQKQVLIDIYTSFLNQNAAEASSPTTPLQAARTVAGRATAEKTAAAEQATATKRAATTRAQSPGTSAPKTPAPKTPAPKKTAAKKAATKKTAAKKAATAKNPTTKSAATTTTKAVRRTTQKRSGTATT